jgi:hypothetical protein
MNRLIENINSIAAELAANFASELTHALLGALTESSTTELAETLTGGASAPVRARSARPAARTSRASKPGVPRKTKAAKAKTGRLARRTPEQIAEAIADVASLLKRQPEGLRSEQIRELLKLDKREIPRLLQQGVADGAIKILHGEKRATTYGVKGGKKKAKPAKKAPKKSAKKPAKKAPKRAAKKAPKAKVTKLPTSAVPKAKAA